VFSYGIITLVAALTCATAAMYTVDFEDYASDLTPTALHSDPLFSHLLTGPSAMKWKAEIMFLGAQVNSLSIECVCAVLIKVTVCVAHYRHDNYTG